MPKEEFPKWAAFHWPTLQTVVPARVAGLHRNHIVDLLTADGGLPGRPAGRMLQDRSQATAMPAVGDWTAALPDGTIQEILPRRTVLARRSAADRDRIQILATNIDKAIVISSLNREHDPVRLDRMVRLAEASGATPVIALSKSDLSDDSVELGRRVERAFPGIEVFVISSRTGEGIAGLERSLAPGETVVMLGRSGVGKSTLANTMLGWERQKTAEIRETDDRGRHATTSRELFTLPDGALLIDTPRPARPRLDRSRRPDPRRRRGRTNRRTGPRDRTPRRLVPLPRLRPRDRTGLRGHRRDRSGRAARALTPFVHRNVTNRNWM